MSTELTDIRLFLKVIPPFDLLPDTLLDVIVKEINICYLRKQDNLPSNELASETLFILRKGALSYFTAENELLGMYGESDICTIYCHPQTTNEIILCSNEDTLLYALPYPSLQKILCDFPDVIAFFEQSAEQRLHKKMARVNDEAIISSSLMNTPITHFYHTPLASIDHKNTIQEAALKMTELGYSCLIVLENDNFIGIVTDKDIRRRCVAKGLSLSQPIKDIITEDPTTIDVNSNAYDALMVMTSKHIHHLPVTNQGKLEGMLTSTDLMNYEGQNAVNLTSIIHKAATVSELSEISKMLPQLQIRMAKLGTSADHVGKSISAITMAFTIRLIEMAEKRLGQAPVPYAWLAAGSQARQEQLAHSDQDNALIISDKITDKDHAWFLQLATFVSDGLAECGFIYCPGNIMATNMKWRQPQKVWRHYFDEWVNTPSSEALLNASIFFDLTTVHGDPSLLKEVRQGMLEKTKRSSLFIAHLSKNALRLKPPLGFFRDFVLKHDGENKSVLDLKHNGIAPIVDLARIYALAEGITPTNTIERLQKVAGSRSLTKESAANLIDAYEFITMLRMQNQSTRMQNNKKPNNLLPPKALSKLEREHLKDAFKVIKTMQDVRQSSY